MPNASAITPAIGRGGRLARIVRAIMRPRRTLGMAVVAAIIGPREILLHGHPERVLVAGPMPDVGQQVGWARLDRSTLIACVSLRPDMPVIPRGHQAPFWEGELTPAVLPGRGVFENASPGCESDRAGRPWVLLLTDAEWLNTLTVWRGDADHMADGWVAAAALQWAALEAWLSAGPTGGTPVMVIDASDRLYAWWLRGNLFEVRADTSQAWQAVSGDIDTDGGELALAAAAAIAAPEVEGFAPVRLARHAALEADEDGRLWAAAVCEEWGDGCLLDLLFGSELANGDYRYAIAVRSNEGELPPGPFGKAQDPYGEYIMDAIRCGGPVEPGWQVGVYNAGGGSLPEGWQYVGHSHYQLDDPEAESTVLWTSVPIWLPPNGSLRVEFGGAGLPNGGTRIYWAQSRVEYHYPWDYEYFDDGPEMVADIPNPAAGAVIIDAPSGGPAPPSVSTLYLQRVRVTKIRSGIPGTIARRIYRTEADGETFGLVGEVAGNDDHVTWDDTTGPSIGAPPRFDVASSARAIVAGAAAEVGAIAGGFAWEVIEPWTAAGFMGGPVGIMGLRDNQAVLAYTDGSGRLVARRYRGGWDGPVILGSGGSRNLLGTIGIFDHEGYVCWREYSDDGPGAWLYAKLDLHDGGLALVAPADRLDAAGDFPPRLTWHDRWEVLVLQGGLDNGGNAQVLTGLDDRAVSAGEPVSLAALDGEEWVAPRVARSDELWALMNHYTDDGDAVALMLWRPL